MPSEKHNDRAARVVTEMFMDTRDLGEECRLIAAEFAAVERDALDYARRVREKVTAEREARMLCLECGLRTLDQYVIHDELWKEAVPGLLGQLHLKCIEKRIGRPLRASDLKKVPLNHAIFHFLGVVLDADDRRNDEDWTKVREQLDLPPMGV